MTPDNHTIQEFFLPVGEGHQLYIHDWGTKTAAHPIVVLHGGPGGSVQDKLKQQFDPSTQRVIFFDQRGCGKSLPFGSLEHNTTSDLIEDIEKIVEHLQLPAIVITGGSWGSCLALAYALAHPERVTALVLRGIFTGSAAEIEWVDKGHFASHYPDVWEHYLEATPLTARDDPSSYHVQRALGDDPVAAKASAFAYQNLEGGIMSLDDRFVPENYENYDPSGSRIELHYLSQGCFLEERYILEHAHQLTMPVWLIQGRYDMVCPPQTAYALSKTIPDIHLLLTTSGHRDEHESWNLTRNILAEWGDKK
jgi:proline iminopeptidase